MKDKEEKTQEDFEADAERADDLRQEPEWLNKEMIEKAADQSNKDQQVMVIAALAKTYDFEGMAKAFHEWNIDWHAEEWKNLTTYIRESLLVEIEEWAKNRIEDYDDRRELLAFLESKRKK